MEVDVNKIANLIADIQQAQSRLVEDKATVKRAENDLEEAKGELEYTQRELKELREQLEDYIEELTGDDEDAAEGLRDMADRAFPTRF